jgi:predicted ATPase
MTSAPARTTRRATQGATSRYTPEYLLVGGWPRSATLDEERREVVDGVRHAMRIHEPDADRVAACAYLLRHLARTEHRP